MHQYPQTYLMYLGVDGFTDETLLVIEILSPLVEGTEGKHAFSLVKTALGDWVPKKAEAKLRIKELLTPHFIAKNINPTTGIPASLSTSKVLL